MTTCRFCAEEIQEAAVVCKHCGRDLVPVLAGNAPAAAPTTHKLSTGAIIVVVLGLLVLVGAVRSMMAPAAPSQPQKALHVTVRTSVTAVEITNHKSTEAVGRELIVYVNGQPPFTYKATSTVPPLGQHVTIPLMTFTKKDGTRFNPLATAVTVIWVGGGGYDYSSFAN